MALEDDVLNALFAAASGLSAAGWPDFLALLARQTRAESATLHLSPAGRPVISWHHGPPLPVPDEVARMRTNRVYAQGDLPGLRDRVTPLRGLRCSARSQGTALVLLTRQGEDFRAIDGVQLSALVPYLGPALETWQALRHERRRAARDRDLARDLGAAWILFSAGGQVLDRAPGLEPLLAGTGIRLSGEDRLLLPEAGAAEALRAALAQAVPGAAPALLVPSAAPRLEMLVSALPDGPRLARLRRAPRAVDLSLDRLARHCALAPAEARLAQLICDGHSLAEAATTLGWTLESTRSASKQVFARMEVRGQGGVIRRMQSGALWLAERQAQTRAEGARPDGTT